jgi:hypothetical protein
MNRIAALLLVAAGTAQAQAVWRCGTDGRVYGETPCAEGRTVAVDDARSADQVAAARLVAARERQLSEQLVREREVRERRAALDARAARRAVAQVRLKPTTGEAATGLRPSTLEAAPTTRPHRPADDGIFRATAPSSRRTPG